MPDQLAAHSQTFEIVEASISDIRDALDSNRVTAVDIAAQCLHRIARYDCNGPTLNAIPILYPHIFEEASASDERRARGKVASHLDGVPYTVKDSYQVKGMTVANGSPALQHLVSSKDAFAVQALKEAGAILIGRTNMPPMAYGGMQRGVYGRAENPYNPEYLAAAFASGSSNGSAVSTAASFAAFGLGSETVSSGRSPASNNGLVAYTPSKGYISIRGVWPLYPTCDDLVPHTRTVDDMLELLDIISAEDPVTGGDFWRHQQFVQLSIPPKPSSFRRLSDVSLAGLRIAVPSCYIGGPQLSHSLPVTTSPEVVALWTQARLDLEAQGAEVIVVEEFPLVQVYENPDCAAAMGRFNLPRLPADWNSVERGTLIARTWDSFLRANGEPSLDSLDSVDASRLFPAVAADHPQIAYAEPTNAVHFAKLKEYLAQARSSSPNGVDLIYATPNLPEACRTFESLRKELFEDWLAKHNFDLVVFPAAGDVGKADADAEHPSAKHAWTNGVKYSNGNRAIRHLGVPTVTVPMGVINGKNVPMGLTLCGPAYSDLKLLGWAKALEMSTKRRKSPTLTPPIETQSLQHFQTAGTAPFVSVEVCRTTPSTGSQVNIEIHGSITIESTKNHNDLPHVEIFIDSHLVPRSSIEVHEQHKRDTEGDGQHIVHIFSCEVATTTPKARSGYGKTEARIARDQNMVVVLGWMMNESEKRKSRPSGWYGLV